MKTYEINYTAEHKTKRETLKMQTTWLANNCIEALNEFEDAFNDTWGDEYRCTFAQVKPERGEDE